MIANLTFNLPEDKEEYDIYNNAYNYYSALWELREELRQVWKYSDHKFMNVDEVWRIFPEILGDSGVEL